MVKKDRTLFLLTESFPFGQGEVFVANEFPFLSKFFKKVIVFTNGYENNDCRNVPENAEIVRLPKKLTVTEKRRAFKKAFCFWFWEELLIVIFRYKLFPSLERLKHFMYYLRKGVLVSECLEKLIKTKDLQARDIIVYSYWGNELAAGAAFFKKKYPMTKFIYRVHGFDLYFERSPIKYLPLREFIANHADGIYPISKKGQAYLKLKISRKNWNKIHVAYLGTLNRTQKRTVSSLNRLQILSCSSLTEIKRVHFIPKALQEMDPEIKVTWTHFGGGALEKEIENLVAQIIKNRPNVVVNLMGNQPNSNVLRHYETKPVDLFVNVSNSEGLPVSIMEAMSFGVPVLATQVGGTEEIVSQGINGFLLEVNTPSVELGKAIKDFWFLPKAEKKVLRENAFLTWMKHFDGEKNYPGFIKMLEELP